MPDDFASKLRTEIWEAQKRRHELSMRKLAFSSGLLGVGALNITVEVNRQLDLTPLLYLVPFVAIAFDFYILDEEYGIKRTGQFLSLDTSGAGSEEKEWERFVRTHPNRLSPIASFVVTMILLTGAALALWQTSPKLRWFLLWIVFVVMIEAGLMIYSLLLRNLLMR
jgi:hypothetical protein